jgi:hypothetical protein
VAFQAAGKFNCWKNREADGEKEGVPTIRGVNREEGFKGFWWDANSFAAGKNLADFLPSRARRPAGF